MLKWFSEIILIQIDRIEQKFFFSIIVHFDCFGLPFLLSFELNGLSFRCFFVSADVSCPPNTLGLFVASYLTDSFCDDGGTSVTKWEVGDDVVEYVSFEEIFGEKTASATGVVVDGVAGANGSKADAAAASANFADVGSGCKVCVLNGSAIFNRPRVV